MRQINEQYLRDGRSAPMLPFVSLFKNAVARFSDRIAIQDSRQRISYRELDYLSNRISYEMRARGVRSGQVVGICRERDTLYLAAVIGIFWFDRRAEGGNDYPGWDGESPVGQS